jgi:hypothetical protein
MEAALWSVCQRSLLEDRQMFDYNKSFLGQGWSFPPSFSARNKQVDLVAYDEDIQQSLEILLSTRPGERLMHPTFGCNLHQRVFDNMSISTIALIKNSIDQSILFFEPRISLNEVVVQLDDFYEGRIDILIDYTVRKTNTRTNLVYPFYYKQATNVQLDKP